MWTVIQRELRELARQKALYGLRLLGGGVMMVLLWLAWERAEPGPGTSGRGFFLGLNRLLFLGLWLVGPILTADCLSREKREGTLGLLFLTPLRPVDVVVGKAFSQSARAFLFVLATLPVMVIPVLLGGVVWKDALRMLFLQLAALGLALAAGLAASSLTLTWWRARLLAFVFALGAGLLFVFLHLSVQVIPMHLAAVAKGDTRSLVDGYLGSARSLFARSGLGQVGGFDQLWHDWPGVPTSTSSVQFAALVWIASWLLVGVIVYAAALGVRRTWRLEPPSSGRLAAERALVEVRFGRRHWKSRRIRALDRNPIRWLESRSWDARVSGWLLAGAALLASVLTMDGFSWRGSSLYLLLRPALIGVMAFAATASFRGERESGALELWLVTPLSPRMILRGRLAGLLARCAGAFGVLVLLPYLPAFMSWLAGLDLSPGRRQWLAQRSLADLNFTLWMVATATLGIALSLSRLSFLPAFGLTWVMHHTPYVFITVVEWSLNRLAQHQVHPRLPWDPVAVLHWSNFVLAGMVLLWSWPWARRQLAERRFLPGLQSTRLPAWSIPREVQPP